MPKTFDHATVADEAPITPRQVATTAIEEGACHFREPSELQASGRQPATQGDSGRSGHAGGGVSTAKRSRCEQREQPCSQSGATQPTPQAPRCIAALKIDGGTSFYLDKTTARWSPELRKLIKEVRTPHTPRVPSADRWGVILTV